MNDNDSPPRDPIIDRQILDALKAGESVTSIKRRLGLQSYSVIRRLRDNPEEQQARKLYGRKLVKQVRQLIAQFTPDINAIAGRLDEPPELIADILQAVPRFRAALLRRQLCQRIDPELLKAIEEDLRDGLDRISMHYCYGVSLHDIAAIASCSNPERETDARRAARIRRSPRMRQAIAICNASISERWGCSEPTANQIRIRLWAREKQQ